MDANSKNAILSQVEENAKFFEIRIIVKLFGHVIIDYTWPPKKS